VDRGYVRKARRLSQAFRFALVLKQRRYEVCPDCSSYFRLSIGAQME